MKVSTKIWILATLLITFSALAIKFYFMPLADRFIKLTIQEQMHRDMKAFEQIIGVVVTAAGTDKEFVRRALNAISADKQIPIELRRSDFLDRQFGKRPGKEPKNDFEKLALSSGMPAFRETEQFIEYVYPLKAQNVCQGCHIDNKGIPIPLGSPVGLAIRRVPRTMITDSSIGYFATDLFWENLALVAGTVLILLGAIYNWLLLPLGKSAKAIEEFYDAKESEHPEEDHGIDYNPEKRDEWYWIKKTIDDLRK